MSGYPVEIANSDRAVGISSPASATLRSEQGVGALMQWADRLYFLTYQADWASGQGGFLGYIDQTGKKTLVDQHNSCHTGRLVHKETNQLLLGPYIIGLDGTINTITSLRSTVRISGWARHHASPTTKATLITMEGDVYECDLATYSVTKLTATTIGTQISMTTNVHYKSIWLDSASGQYVACCNANYPNGRLVKSVDGATWSVLSSLAGWNDVGGWNSFYTFALGYDYKSAILATFASDLSTIYKYRLPRYTRTMDNYITQEWPRIRPIQTERSMMQAFGTWYQVSQWLNSVGSGGNLGLQGTGVPGVHVPVVEPVGITLRTVNDWTMFNGKLAIGSNESSEQKGAYPLAGQSSGAITFGNLDDIVRSGKPVGEGYFWWRESVTLNTASDPMLVHGYDKKSLHFYNNTATPATVTIGIIKLNIGVSGVTANYPTTISVAANAYTHFEFPDGWAADWITLSSSATVSDLTAWLECR